MANDRRKRTELTGLPLLVLRILQVALQDAAKGATFAAWWLRHDGADLAAWLGIEPDAWQASLRMAGIASPAVQPEPGIEGALLVDYNRNVTRPLGRPRKYPAPTHSTVRLLGALPIEDRIGRRLFDRAQLLIEETPERDLRAALSDLARDREFIAALCAWLGME